MTILGTRPEIIRLSLIIDRLDKLCDHVLVHTGQNYDYNLNELFFQQLGIRQPDFFLGAVGSFGEQIGKILSVSEELMRSVKPDRFLVLGDTNSALAAFTAKRLGIPVFHMEAGNRCFDDRVPEEVNRRVIDHSSDVLMPYTERSRANLIREGIDSNRIFVTGNPIYEVIKRFEPETAESTILEQLKLTRSQYFLVTIHRQENVDVSERLESILSGLELIHLSFELPIICSVHPRTKSRLQQLPRPVPSGIILHEPFGFFDFISLEKNALCVLSDSGTVQEECCIFQVPNVTVRDVTERPETLECGSNMLSGAVADNMLQAARTVLHDSSGSIPKWVPPAEYIAEGVSNTVTKIVLGYSIGLRPPHGTEVNRNAIIHSETT